MIPRHNNLTAHVATEGAGTPQGQQPGGEEQHQTDALSQRVAREGQVEDRPGDRLWQQDGQKQGRNGNQIDDGPGCLHPSRESPLRRLLERPGAGVAS